MPGLPEVKESTQSSREHWAAVLHVHSDRKSLLRELEVLLDIFLSVTEVANTANSCKYFLFGGVAF